MDKNQVKDQIMTSCKFRFACKEFDQNKKISDSDFEFILQVARLSPSSFGIEPWKFLVIQGKSIRQKMLGACYGAQNQLKTASHFIVMLARKKLDTIYSSKYVDYLQREVKKLPSEELVKDFVDTYHTFQKSNNLVDDATLFAWSSKQTYIALGNMMSAAAQIGIDSCAMEGFDRNELEKILEENGLLSRLHFGIACLIAFGYRKNDPPFPKTRNPLQNIVKFV